MFWYESFRYLPYVKRYFQEHQWSAFFFRAQISQILLFSSMLVLERSKITVLGQDLFSVNFFAMKVLGICLPYVKRCFIEHQWSAFFFRAQITQILLFLRMSVSERLKMTAWEQHLFQNLFCHGSFMYVPTLRKKVFFISTKEVVFSLGLKCLRFCSFLECLFWRDQRSQYEGNTFSKNLLSWKF